MDKINTIIQGETVTELKKIPDKSADMIFADPPYFLQLENELLRPNENKYDGVEDAWDKFADLKEYDTFCENWLRECNRILKSNGTIWVIGTYHNIFRIGKILQDLGYWILNDIVWVKTNPTPNFKGSRFNNAHETLIWASKSKSSAYTFNYQAMKRFNEDKQMRSDWLIPICNGPERLLDEQGKKIHPTQKPEAILTRVILSSTSPGDIVLDPFFGSGTTGAVAKRFGRNWIGIDREPTYISAAQKRIDSIDEISDINLLTTVSRRNTLKVKFSDLISEGMISVGENIYSKDKQNSAQIKADSTVKLGSVSGSIHKMAAHLLNKKSHNGWDYWHIDYEQKFVSLNILREIYKKQMQGDNYEVALEDLTEDERKLIT